MERSVVVAPPVRSYTSNEASVSAAASFSLVSKKTRVPSAEVPAKRESKAALPGVPADTSTVVPPERSYTSTDASVSPATRGSRVSKNTRAPLLELPS